MGKGILCSHFEKPYMEMKLVHKEMVLVTYVSSSILLENDVLTAERQREGEGSIIQAIFFPVPGIGRRRLRDGWYENCPRIMSESRDWLVCTGAPVGTGDFIWVYNLGYRK